MAKRHRVAVYLDGPAYRIWNAMPKGVRSYWVCRMLVENKSGGA